MERGIDVGKDPQMWRGHGFLCGLHFTPVIDSSHDSQRDPMVFVYQNISLSWSNLLKALITLRTKSNPFPQSECTGSLTLPLYFQPVTWCFPALELSLPSNMLPRWPSQGLFLCPIHSFPNIRMARSFTSFWPLLKAASSKTPSVTKQAVSPPSLLICFMFIDSTLSFTNWHYNTCWCVYHWHP